MFPIFTLFGKDISMYALMAVLGMLVSGFVFCRNIKRSGYDDNDAIIFLLIVSIGIMIGGHILYGITNIRHIPSLFSATGVKDFLTIFGSIFGGSVFYGGLIGAIIFGLSWIKLKHLPFKIYTDNCALFAPLFHGFARIGCFLGGCCYGIEVPWGISASENTFTTIGSVPRFPVQLLEAFFNFCIALFIYWLLRSKKLQGKLFCVYLLLYSPMRFFNEFLRGDEIRGFILGLSTSQFISILIAFLSALILIILCKRDKVKSNEQKRS